MTTSLHVICGGVTMLGREAIVNAANASLLGGDGVDGAIHRAAGPELLRKYRLPGGCKTGDAKTTKRLSPGSRICHYTVGPAWHGMAENSRNHAAVCCR